MEDAELKKTVDELRKQGKSLNEILDVLHKEHNVRITFLELRMLVAEIEKSEPVKKPDKKLDETPDEEPTADLGTEVAIDQIMQPGAQLSGSAKLQSGARIKWFVDAMRRLNVSLEPGSSQPTEQDTRQFQQALAQKLQRGG